MNSRGHRTWTRATIAASLIGLLGAGLTACGDDPRDEAPLLEAVWSSGAPGAEWSIPEDWVATEDLWIFGGKAVDALAAISLSNGKSAWTVPTSQMCELSEVTATGLLAVLDSTTGRPTGKCDRLRLVNTADGSVKWSARAKTADSALSNTGPLSVTETTVAATSDCGVDRWSVSTGKSLGRLKGYRFDRPLDPPPCADIALAGSVALIANDTGITGVDVDTGRQRWDIHGAAPSVNGIYSVDPLLASIRLDGVGGVRQVDPATGTLGPLIGRPGGGDSFLGEPLGNLTATGGQAVGSYAGGFELDRTYNTAVRGWDLATGKEKWHVSGDTEDYLGADKHGVYLGRTIAAKEAKAGEHPARAYWLMRWDPASKTRKTLGWIQGTGATPIRVGDLLIAHDNSLSANDKLTAYRLPKTAKKLTIPANVNAEKPMWRKGDAHPDPAVDPCTAVSEDTLRRLGFKAALTMPPPRTCSWFESPVGLTVTAEIIKPTEDRTATSLAIEKMAAAKKSYEATEEIDGLGDQAWVRRETYVAPGGRSLAYGHEVARTTNNLTLIVRERNVMVTIEARVASDLTYNSRSYALPWSIETAESAVLDAASDVMKATGLTLKTPTATQPDPNTVTELPDLCAPTAAAIKPVIPKAKPEKLDLPGEKRLHGCLWATRHEGKFVLDYVQIVAYAAGPGSLPPTSASAVAADTFETSRSPLARKVSKAGWDQAAEFVDSNPYSQDGHLVVRRGNLVIVVQVGLRNDAQVDQSALMRKIADQVLAKTG